MYESETFPVRKYLLTFRRNRVFPLALSSVGDRQMVYLSMIPILTHAAFETESFPFQCHNNYMTFLRNGKFPIQMIHL